MAIFTAAAVAAFIGVEVGFFATATAFVLNAAVVSLASIGVSYAAQAVAGHQNQPAAATDSFGVQGRLAGGGDVPRSFNLGYSVTPGSLVYANTHGGDTATPNAYITQVIALSDLPGGTLLEFWVNGEKVTLSAPLVGGGQGDDAGYAVPEYVKPRSDGGAAVAHLYIKYYDGTQTAADPYLVGTVASEDRPYANTRVGVGVAYVICTSLVNEKLWNGIPTFKFALSGVPLYDPSRDDSAGGDGDQRYDDRSTWGGDGDSFPAVQVYNILRGLSYNGVWLYGLQNTSAARLPVANWIAQITKCRAPIDGDNGPEPTYRSGMQVSVNSQPANAITALLTACQGRPSEIGGFYKLRVGAPDSPTFSFTDADIVSIEPQTFRPFFALADSVNGIQGRYPDPAQGWEYDTAPPYYRTDLEARDGNRRLMASPSFDAVPYPAQVQRLQRSAIEEAQRARGHTVVLPPWYWTVEPGDVGAWTSPGNGYVTKRFRVDVAVDKYNLDMGLSLTEVDPADFDPSAFVPVTTGPTAIVRPAAQGVVDWNVEPWTLPDSSGIGRRPAIRISWDSSLPGIVGIQFEVRLATDGSAVTRGNSPPETSAIGAIIVSQSLIPDEDYGVRIQYLPSAPRDMLWSEWRPVTTPNILISIAEFDAALAYQVTAIQESLSAKIDDFEQRFATLTSKLAAQSYTDVKSVRSQLASRSGAAFAEISRVETASTSADAAMATDIETIAATVDGNTSQIEVNATAISGVAGDLADYKITVSADFGDVNTTVTEHATAIATLDGYAAGTWGVAIDVDGNVVGIVLANDSDDFSFFSVTADNFRVAFPGHAGGAAVPVFDIQNVGGVAKIVWRGDMVGDGSILAPMIGAAEVQTIHLGAQVVTAGKVKTGEFTSDSGVFGALGVKSLSLGDNAVTVPVVATVASHLGVGSGQAIFNFNLSIDTTGLSEKTIAIFVSVFASLSFTAINQAWDANLLVNGTQVSDMSGTNGTFYYVSGALNVIGTGGVMSINVTQNWNCSNQGQIVNSVAFAEAAKR